VPPYSGSGAEEEEGPCAAMNPRLLTRIFIEGARVVISQFATRKQNKGRGAPKRRRRRRCLHARSLVWRRAHDNPSPGSWLGGASRPDLDQ
jgi:hypothetical protein